MPTFDELELSRYDGSRFELYRFETDDVTLGTYTTDRNPMVFALHNYVPIPISRSEVKQAITDSASQRLTITVPFNLPVAAIHVPYMPPTPVKVTIYAVQRGASSLEVKQFFVGYITSFGQKGPEAEFNVSNIIDSQGQQVPWIVHKQGCVWATYEDGCEVAKAPFEDLITSYTASGTNVNSLQFGARGSDWFRSGYLFNPANGEKRFITEHIGNDVTIVYPFIGLAPGAPLYALAGDDHQPETCRLKFNNKQHYFGFDHTPDYNLFDKGIL